MEEDGLAKARRVVAEAKEGLAEQRPTTNGNTAPSSVLEDEAHLIPLALLEEDTLPGDRKLTSLLMTRLLLEEDIARQANSIAEQKLDSPLFIIGLPRTGSTLLHHLLANDEDAFNTVKLWEIRRPVDTRECPSEQERLRVEREYWDRFHKEKPLMAAIHDVRADFPGECISVLELDLLCGTQIFRGVSPKYIHWYMNISEERAVQAYQFHKRFMQRMQLKRGNNKPWLWKTPLHTFFLSTILAVYPDAKFIWTHRDPVQSIPSTCSLGAAMGGINPEDPTQLKQLGSIILDTFSEGVKRAILFRETHEDLRDRFFDCQMEELMRDPMEVLKRIYSFIGQSFTQEREERAKEWLQVNPQNKHGSHHYFLESFGLEAPQIQQVFKEYRDWEPKWQ